MNPSQTIQVLRQIREKGNIRPEGHAISIHYQKINHALAGFLNSTPVNPEGALSCMDELNEICRNTAAFFSFFPKVMMDLYDWAVTGDSTTQRFAETKLLLYFSNIAPHSVDQKNKLLNQIQQMPDFTQRKGEVSKVVSTLAQHYDLNGQFNKDPGLSVLKSLSTLLNQLCTKKSKTHHSGEIAREKASFLNCASVIKSHAPKLYNNQWTEELSLQKKCKFCVPCIKDAADVYLYKSWKFCNQISSRNED